MIKKSRDPRVAITRLNLLAVRFFRPAYPAADISDFDQENRKVSCVTSTELWKNFLTPEKSAALIACINGLNQTLNYIYVPQTQPELVIDPLRKSKDQCLYALMPSLPLPREVYFLATRSGKRDQETFEMSFDSKDNQIAETELRAPRFEVRFVFPRLNKLVTAQDLNVYLLTSVLSLFIEKNKAIQASIVPEQVEQNCFETDPLFPDKKMQKIPPVFWP